MAKGSRGGKRTGSLSTITNKSEFVWKLGEQGINNPNKIKTINQFLKKNSGDYQEMLAAVDQAATEIRIAQMRGVPVFLYDDDIPQGWTPISGALTAPNGFKWYSNNKSRLSGQRQTALVAIKDYFDDLYFQR